MKDFKTNNMLMFMFLVVFFVIENPVVFSMPENKSNTNYFVDPPYLDSTSMAWAKSVMRKMSLNEKIGQLFMLAAYSNKDYKYYKEVAYLIRKYRIGGLIFMQGSPDKQVNLTNYYQKISKTPLLIAMDAEWGLAMRLENTIKYPEQMALGAIQDNYLIYEMGRDIALQLKRMGVHVNFAPVVDINNNPNNPVINSRSFGEDKKNVTNKSLAYMLGMQDNHILATAKHFPGHGDTDKDSHYDLPVVMHDYQRIDSLELYPYKELMKYGLGGIMTAHLHVPSIDSLDGLPTSLSSKAINDLLREKMGFKGIIISDALNMKGVTQYGNGGKVELEAFKAGNDILLFPQEVPKAVERIRKEIKKGKISIDDLNERCLRILALKKWVGLDEFKPISKWNLDTDLHTQEYMLTRKRLIEASVTLLHNKDRLIPLKRLDTLRIASVSIGDSINEFQDILSLYSNIDHFFIDKNVGKHGFDSLRALLEPYNLLVTSIHKPSRRASLNFGVNENTINFIETIAREKRVILSLFANPYSLRAFNDLKKVDGIFVSYQDDSVSRRSTAQALFGGTPVDGRLPVSIAGYFNTGHGFKIDSATRLGYALPEELGIRIAPLERIDSIVNDAIEKRAMPGCQVMCIKDGVVFFNKAYGYHTYLKKQEVKTTDLYDLASITKISASVPALMTLTDQGEFHMGERISTYLPRLVNTNKNDMVGIELLTHQSKLKPWIPFYINLLEPLYKDDHLFSSDFSTEYPIKISKNTFLNRHFRLKEDVRQFWEDTVYRHKVAEYFYLHNRFRDTIFNKLDNSELREKNSYKYSDLGFYYFYQIVEQLTNQNFDYYLDSTFYSKLGAYTLGFKPLDKFERKQITPTENDRIFRQQIIKGHVHDPGAAMLGGVCGHAGLFSNANDLAKLMQMYLNKGTYGGERYINAETIDLFTSCPFCKKGIRRGIGFDKPEPDEEKGNPVTDYASLASYGHSGFTGTLTWVDPEYNMIYIFLSNRVHPDQNNPRLVEMNIRTKIHEEFYKAVME